MDDLPVGADFDQLRGLDDPPHVGASHFAFFARDRDDATVVRAVHVLARDSDVDVGDLNAGHPLGFFGRSLDRTHRLLEIRDDALAQPG